MAYDITPSLFRFPAFRLANMWDDDEEMTTQPGPAGGLSISEDAKSVYVEAALPGLETKDIEITFDKGILWIKGEKSLAESDKNRKYYRRSAASFSYRVAVPGEIDVTKDPDASFKNGVMTITFSKSPASQPRKITIR